MKDNKMVNKRVGRWLVISFSYRDSKYCDYWDCICACGNKKIVSGNNLRMRNTKSCGCLQKERAIKNNIKYKTKHGLTKTRFYRIWRCMKNRCFRESNDNYKYYGGRGIKVYKRWLTFQNFKNDMYKDYLEHIEEFGEKDTSIDRINNDKNYCNSNCRWATIKEQANNRTSK